MLQGIALRGLFIIDKEGVIQHSTINNLAIGRSVDETMRTLQVILFYNVKKQRFSFEALSECSLLINSYSNLIIGSTLKFWSQFGI